MFWSTNSAFVHSYEYLKNVTIMLEHWCNHFLFFMIIIIYNCRSPYSFNWWKNHASRSCFVGCKLRGSQFPRFCIFDDGILCLAKWPKINYWMSRSFYIIPFSHLITKLYEFKLLKLVIEFNIDPNLKQNHWILFKIITRAASTWYMYIVISSIKTPA